eukprot:GFUD01082314.1.p1 GENE.GFUD01082314.1~~GFUD01082314.1.p1  ORF type:complete len:176 (+),score=26.93 GFUD01082314.1:70-597(+)
MTTPGLILLCLISSLVATDPCKTDSQPTMEIVDDQTVLVDYRKCFVIPDFAQIKAISVYLITGRNIAVATREDISNLLNGHLKIFQPLQQNTKLRGRLNPCFDYKFFVRIVYHRNPGYLDSLDSVKGKFRPNKTILEKLNCPVIMKSSSMMLPFQMMMMMIPVILVFYCDVCQIV